METHGVEAQRLKSEPTKAMLYGANYASLFTERFATALPVLGMATIYILTRLTLLFQARLRLAWPTRLFADAVGIPAIGPGCV